MGKTKLISIDAGYDSYKVYDGKNKTKFVTKIVEDDGMERSNTDKFTYNDVTYLIGEGGNIINYERNKENDIRHKIMTLYCCAKSNTEENVIVAGTYPLTIYKFKNNYADYLKDKESNLVKLNGEEKLIKIEQVKVIPQGAGVIYANAVEYSNRMLGVLDIGGLTINGAIFDRLNTIDETKFTEDLGIHVLYERLREALVSKHTRDDIMIQRIPYILDEGLKYKGVEISEARATMNTVIEIYLNSLKAVMRKHNWDINTTPIIITGGGAIVLEEYIRNQFETSIIKSQNCVYDNAIGAYSIVSSMM